MQKVKTKTKPAGITSRALFLPCHHNAEYAVYKYEIRCVRIWRALAEAVGFEPTVP